MIDAGKADTNGKQVPVITVPEVSAILERYRTNEMPTFVAYNSVLHLIARFQGFWRGHADACLKEVEAKVRDLLEAHIGTVFGTFPQAKIKIR